MRTHEQLCRTHGEAMPPAGSGTAIACRLASQRLLLADPGRKRSAQRVSLNVPVEDVVYALKETRVERAAAAAAAAKARAGVVCSFGSGGVSVDGGVADGNGIGEAGLDHGDIPWLRNHPGL
jgi:origin recognition complex subunit 1